MVRARSPRHPGGCESSAASTAGWSPRGRSQATGGGGWTRIGDRTSAARFEIDDWRWAGVPFYVRTGKRLPKRASEIAIQFRPVPHRLFRDSALDPEPNLLAMRIQPDEGILLRFGAKVPGLGLDVRAVNMDFTYGSAFNVDSPDAYETLILDALLGDASLFTRADEVDQLWAFVDPIGRAGPRGRDAAALRRGPGDHEADVLSRVTAAPGGSRDGPGDGAAARRRALPRATHDPVGGYRMSGSGRRRAWSGSREPRMPGRRAEAGSAPLPSGPEVPGLVPVVESGAQTAC